MGRVGVRVRRPPRGEEVALGQHAGVERRVLVGLGLGLGSGLGSGSGSGSGLIIRGEHPTTTTTTTTTITWYTTPQLVGE